MTWEHTRSLVLLAALLAAPAVIEHPVAWVGRALGLIIVFGSAAAWAFDNGARRGWWAA